MNEKRPAYLLGWLKNRKKNFFSLFVLQVCNNVLFGKQSPKTKNQGKIPTFDPGSLNARNFKIYNILKVFRIYLLCGHCLCLHCKNTI